MLQVLSGLSMRFERMMVIKTLQCGVEVACSGEDYVSDHVRIVSFIRFHLSRKAKEREYV